MKRKAKFLSVLLIMALLISLQPSSLSVIAADYVAPVSGLNVEKTAEPYGAADADGRQVFKLNITAVTESNIVVTSKPCDIILVLDDSGSMDYSINNYSYEPRTTTPNTNRAYYVKVDGKYYEVNYDRYQNNPNPQPDLYAWRYDADPGSDDEWRYVSWSVSGDDNAAGNADPSNPTAKPFYTRSTTTITKLQALKNAANAFVQTVYTQSPESKIAVVSFAYDAENITGGLVNISNGSGVNSSITNAINSLTGSGATHSNEGLGTAVDIFQADTSTDRTRVVVMFTDGEPGNYGFDDNDGSRYAAAAINQAAVLKSNRGNLINSNVTFNSYTAGSNIDEPRTAVNEPGCGSLVYSVGIFPADVDVLAHRYMAWVSSDNDNSQSATSSEGYDYYFTADSADSLNDIFQSIAEETGQTLENVSIIDYIDPRFNIVNASGDVLNIGDSITIGTETGIIKQNSSGIYIEWIKDKIEPGTLAEGKGFSGSFYIKPKSDFIGGNVIPTNIANLSAIYVGGQSIASLPNPTVNVVFKLNVSDITDDIFLGEGILKSQTEAQDIMLALNPDYSYPAGFIAYNWNAGFTTDVKPTANSSYTLTATASPYNYIDFSNASVWTPLNNGTTLIGYTKSTGEIYYLPVGTAATQISSSGVYNIIIRTGSISIAKYVNGACNPNQTFVFEIKQYDDVFKTNLIRTFYETIRVENSNNSRLIINLPIGYYEIKELADWSWQYDINGAQTAVATLGMNANGSRNIGKTTASVSFENSSKQIKYLNSIDWVINRFSGDE
ncbi:MAG: vWA domain-containing protein [Eubacteriaceae bacterium]